MRKSSRVIEDLKSNDHAYQGKLLMGRGQNEFCIFVSGSSLSQWTGGGGVKAFSGHGFSGKRLDVFK